MHKMCTPLMVMSRKSCLVKICMLDRCISTSNQPLKGRVWVKWVYFYSKVELAVVWNEAGKNTHLDKAKKEKEI